MFNKIVQSFWKNVKISQIYGEINSSSKVPIRNYCKDRCQKCPDDKASALIRHNFHEECEDGLNEQINAELRASYAYFCMASCLARPDVALTGFARFFGAASAEERTHARTLVDFVQMRGGSVRLSDVPRPEATHYDEPEAALLDSIELEKCILRSIERLHKTASAHGDLVLADLLESQFIPEQYRGLGQLAELLSRVRRAGPGVGIVLIDLDLQRHPPASHGGDTPTH